MGPGFKYHIVTVSAIFFALTVGLVVGGLFVSPRVTDRQTRAIQGLQSIFNHDITAKSQQLRQYQDCLGAILPDFLQNKLPGVPVMLIQTGDHGEADKSVREYLKMAGAQVSEMSLDSTWNRTDEVLQPRLSASHDSDSRIPTDRAGLADLLARTVRQGDPPDTGILPVLDQENFVHLQSEDDYHSGIRLVVLLTGSHLEAPQEQIRLTQVDQPLISALQKQGLTVVVCEPQAIVASDSKAYHDFTPEIPLVREVDTDLGGCALVLTLLGKKTAWALAP